MGKKMTETDRKIVKDFAEWVAEYSLMMHDYKFGTELNQIMAEDEMNAPTSKVPILDQLPDTFMLSEAYRKFPNQPPSSVRSMLSRLVSAKLLNKADRGMYSKSPL